MSARGIRHILVDNLVNAPGDLFDGHAESPPKPAESITRRIDIQLHLTAKKIARIEVAENQIGVGDRWFGAALSITNRPRVCAGTFRTYFQKPERIDPRHTAAAGADLDHVDHRNAHRQPAAFSETINPIHLEFMRLERAAILDDTEFGGGAAHVKR